MQIFEISSKKTKNGKRKFKAILYKIHPDSCVIDNTGTEFNLNGITWIEKYCQNNIDSISGMSVTVEFLDDERVEILGHGDTGVEDGIPIYNNATMIGHFEKGYITDMEVNGEMCRVCVGEGYLDYMRYKPFIDSIETRINNGETIFGSIEIMGIPENENKISYLDGWKPEGRIPTEFVHSGWAILSIKPSDDKSTLVEINQNQVKEDKFKMDEKELKAIIESTIKETNSQNDELSNTITELNSTIVEKDNAISELNASVGQLQKALDDMNKERETFWEEKRIIEEELAKVRVAQRLGEFNSAIEVYSEEEQKYAEVEINAFKEDALNGNIDTVISKICVGIVNKQKENEKVAEQNSANEDNNVEDIFSEVNSADGTEANEETSIF